MHSGQTKLKSYKSKSSLKQIIIIERFVHTKHKWFYHASMSKSILKMKLTLKLSFEES